MDSQGIKHGILVVKIVGFVGARIKEGWEAGEALCSIKYLIADV